MVIMTRPMIQYMAERDEFFETLAVGVHALTALVAALHHHGHQRGVWRDLAAEQAHGELDGLRARLHDTTPEEWHQRSAWSWLSPRDVGELREGVVTLDRLVSEQPTPLSQADRIDLERLTALLERYIENGEVW
jgi:hypothetical protein